MKECLIKIADILLIKKKRERVREKENAKRLLIIYLFALGKCNKMLLFHKIKEGCFILIA